jgi:hypothetical protein
VLLGGSSLRFGTNPGSRRDSPNSLNDSIELELIFLFLSKMTLFDILLYIYLYLEVININKSRKFRHDLCERLILRRDPRISQ